MKEKRNLKQTDGITLIALIITIIVLLILAGVSINAIVGDTGVLNKGKKSATETSKAQVKEEIEFKIAEAQMEKEDGLLSRKDVADAVGTLEDVIVDINEGEIEGEYKDYFFEIDENNKVIVGDKLTGIKPTGIAELITEGEDLEEAQIRVTAEISEGTIASITAVNGAELVESEENTETVKIFKVKENGTFGFKIRAENGRSIRVSCNVSNLVSFSIEDDILTAVQKMNSSGKKKIQVTGKTSDGTTSTEVYSMNVIYHKGDMVLDGSTTYEGSTLISDSKTYEFGNSEKDVATGTAESQMAQNTVVLKVEGNLTIDSGVTLTSVKSEAGYGGPKGMIVYCTGTLTNNGTMSMTDRGGIANSQNVFLYALNSGNFEYVPSLGASGGNGAEASVYNNTKVTYGSSGVSASLRNTSYWRRWWR